MALSCNASPGPMYGKEGLAAEREFIAAAWRDHREFVLHHDLTAALRVGDLSVFRADGSVLLHEIKTNSSRRIKKQDQLLIDTSAVLAHEGTLPSGLTPVRTQIPFRTNLRGLREVLELAHGRAGIQGGVVSPGRAVIAASQYTAPRHYDGDTFGDRFIADIARYQRRIGIRSPQHTLMMTSLDSASRWPTRPPWAIYPLAPEIAASLTADAMFFAVCMSPDTIINRLADAGVQAEWMQPLDGSEDWTKPLLRVAATRGNRLWFSSLNPEAIAGLMLELVDVRTWCQQVALMLGGDVPAGARPWPNFLNEDRTWV